MTSAKKHHKHPPLARPSIGEWGRNEIAFLGAPCGVIRKLTDALSTKLSEKWNTCYVDADHASADTETKAPFKGSAVFTDKINSRRIDLLDNPSRFSRRSLMTPYDVLLVNGNHFSASSQVVLLHSKKKESLQRKTDRLTNVIAIIELDSKLEEYEFLKPCLTSDTIVFAVDEHDKFTDWVDQRIKAPEVKGLVLAGGKSQRMGEDKSQLDFHGMPQREYALKLFDEIGVTACLSCRQDQVAHLGESRNLIPDRFTGLGPFGAILSAMMSDPDSAWLVIATDLPLVMPETLGQLVAQRNPAKVATAFYNPATNFPEPLITLWEPKAYPVLLSYLSQGIACPRKTLINSDIELIEAEDLKWLTNVNTPEDVAAVRSALG